MTTSTSHPTSAQPDIYFIQQNVPQKVRCKHECEFKNWGSSWTTSSFVAFLRHYELRRNQLTHESSRVGDVGADLAIDLDEPLHADLLHLISSQGILEAIPQEDDEGQALPQLVGTGGRTRSLKR